ncbi:MAG TPA: Ger(x)C family spore germination protein [Bacillota bacterium]|nr:Ger(x)C family spore germination protein [Bacillota bacterium]
MKREKSKRKKIKKAFQFKLPPSNFTLLILLAFLFTLSGCWDLTEVDRRTFVTTIGIDAITPQETSVMVQIPLPQRMLPSSATGRGNVQGKQFSVTSITARSVNDALNILQTKTYYELVVEQNKSIIIGAAAAQRGVESLLEYFIRNPKAPPQALVFVTPRHTAAEVLSFEPAQETLPGLQFSGAAQSAAKYDRTYFTSVGQFMSRAFHTATDAFAPLIDIDEKEGMYIEAGLAAFDGFHLAGELDMEETQMYGLISGLMKAGNMTLTLPGNQILSLRNVTAHPAKIKVNLPSVKNTASMEGTPFFSVQVNIYGSLSELRDGHKEIKPAQRRRLELAMQKVLAPKMSKLIEKLQSFNSDIINFGEEFRVQHQEEWKKQPWKQIFPKVRFKVTVKAKIQRDGALR